MRWCRRRGAIKGMALLYDVMLLLLLYVYVILVENERVMMERTGEDCSNAVNVGGAAGLVELTTTMGTFTVEVYAQHVPKTAKNFIELSKKGYYNGTTVRVASRKFEQKLKNNQRLPGHY